MSTLRGWDNRKVAKDPSGISGPLGTDGYWTGPHIYIANRGTWWSLCGGPNTMYVVENGVVITSFSVASGSTYLCGAYYYQGKVYFLSSSPPSLMMKSIDTATLVVATEKTFTGVTFGTIAKTCMTFDGSDYFYIVYFDTALSKYAGLTWRISTGAQTGPTDTTLAQSPYGIGISGSTLYVASSQKVLSMSLAFGSPSSVWTWSSGSFLTTLGYKGYHIVGRTLWDNAHSSSYVLSDGGNASLTGNVSLCFVNDTVSPIGIIHVESYSDGAHGNQVYVIEQVGSTLLKSTQIAFSETVARVLPTTITPFRFDGLTPGATFKFPVSGSQINGQFREICVGSSSWEVT